jgi:hypothetical protein
LGGAEYRPAEMIHTAVVVENFMIDGAIWSE